MTRPDFTAKNAKNSKNDSLEELLAKLAGAEDGNLDGTTAVIGAAIEVHKALGPGLLESVYESALCHELSLRKVPFKRQVVLPINYKNVLLDGGLRLDLLVADRLIIEVKSVERLLPIHEAQLLTYMRLARIPVGLLLNFNVRLMSHGIKRLVLKCR